MTKPICRLWMVSQIWADFYFPGQQHLAVSQRPLTLILLQKYCDTNGRRIAIQIGGVYTTFCQEEGILLQTYAIEMGGVSRYFSKVLGSGVDFYFPGQHKAFGECRQRKNLQQKAGGCHLLRIGQEQGQNTHTHTQQGGSSSLLLDKKIWERRVQAAEGCYFPWQRFQEEKSNLSAKDIQQIP